jgi:hypothetical protein
VPLTGWLFETERLALRPKLAADAESLRFVAAHMRHQETHGFSMWALVERGYGFEELGLTRVSAFTELANAASIRVIEKLGMTFVRAGADGAPAWAEYAVSAPRTPGRASP